MAESLPVPAMSFGIQRTGIPRIIPNQTISENRIFRRRVASQVDGAVIDHRVESLSISQNPTCRIPQ